MPLEVQFRKNTLFINKKPMNFDYEIGNAVALDNKIIFLLRIPNGDDTLQNIYCLSEDCQFLWQVQSIKDAIENISDELPFEGFSINKEGNIQAYDFYGRSFAIDKNNGKVLSLKIVK